jgi:LacI family transcriptional regulator, galactose operon repressor
MATPSGRPTLADVAAQAGVSPATVSRALAHSPLVKERTRVRVREVADHMGFRPNRLASSLRRGATMAVGLVVPDVAAPFYATALKGVQEAVEAAGYHVLVVNTERDARREREALASLGGHQVDGVIVATSGGYLDIGVPAVFIDNVSGPGTAVALENAAGIALLVDHLVTVHAHERIAYVGPPEVVGIGASGVVGSGRERLDAFRAAVGRRGLALPPEYVQLAHHSAWEEHARAATRELLSLPSPPTAILAGSDLLALGVLRGARDRGRAVGHDVAVVSFDEPASADLLDPPVTSLDRHDREIGERAANLLLTLLRGHADPGGVQRLPVELVARRSCGCA